MRVPRFLRGQDVELPQLLADVPATRPARRQRVKAPRGQLRLRPVLVRNGRASTQDVHLRMASAGDSY